MTIQKHLDYTSHCSHCGCPVMVCRFYNGTGFEWSYHKYEFGGALGEEITACPNPNCKHPAEDRPGTWLEPDRRPYIIPHDDTKLKLEWYEAENEALRVRITQLEERAKQAHSYLEVAYNQLKSNPSDIDVVLGDIGMAGANLLGLMENAQ